MGPHIFVEVDTRFSHDRCAVYWCEHGLILPTADVEEGPRHHFCNRCNTLHRENSARPAGNLTMREAIAFALVIETPEVADQVVHRVAFEDAFNQFIMLG